MFDSIVDWASDKVQSFTGEKERRELLNKLNFTYDKYKEKIKKIIEKINDKIEIFNNSIEKLNDYRKVIVKSNIKCLENFLIKFGNLNNVKIYVEEEKQNQVAFPHKKFEVFQNYIRDIDWSKKEIFKKTFETSILKFRNDMKKENLNSRIKLKELELDGERIKSLIERKLSFTEQDIEILGLYENSVKKISETINEKIIPELNLIQAFLQCEEIKNKLINKEDINIKNKNEISLLANTKYDKHYKFVKNTFLFYIISLKIYNTPILTNLLNDSNHEDEKKLAEKYNSLLEKQDVYLKKYKMIEGVKDELK